MQGQSADQRLGGWGWIATLDRESASLSWHGAEDPPVIAADETTTVLFYGRLVAPGDPAQAILTAWRCRGEALIGELQGEFALLIWDRPRDLLIAARDKNGAVPLFHATRGPRTFFSPSLDSITGLAAVGRRVDSLVVARHIAHDWRQAERTLYSDVLRVPAGTLLRQRGSARESHRYWNPLPAGAPVDWVDEDAEERFAEIFGACVERTVADGPTGVFLSGGLDSVSVATVAAEIAGQRSVERPLALSLAFPHPECDERMVQRRVAEALGLSQVMLGFDEATGPLGSVMAAMAVSRTWSQPLLNIWMPAYLALGREGAIRGCQSLFTGGGGDEWLTVGPFHGADLIGRGDLAGLWRQVATSRRSYRLSRWQAMTSVLWTFGAKPRLAKLGRRALQGVSPSLVAAALGRRRELSLPDWLAPDAHLRRELTEPAPWSADDARPDSYYLAAIRHELDHPLNSWESEEIHEQARRTGARIIQPFWDAELVELLMRVRPDRLNQGQRSKGLVRDALEDRLPRLGLKQQQKVTSMEFFGGSLIAQCREAWRQTGGAPMLADLGIVDPRGFESMMDGYLRRGPDHRVSRIWDVLNVESWLQGHLS